MRRLDEPAAVRAALLSLLLPGLGQLADRRWRAAVLFGAPAALMGVAALGVALTGGPGLAVLLAPPVLSGLLLLSLLVLVWRLAAVFEAFRWHAPLTGRRPVSAVPWLLAGVIAVTQLAPTAYAAQLIGAADRIAGADIDSDLFGSAAPVAPSVSGDPVATRSPAGTSVPEPSPSAAVAGGTPTAEPPARLAERVTVLLIGTDDLASRDHRLTDTLMVVSLGAERRRPMMISVPRDLYGAPLPDDLVYNAKLNSLASYARARPDDFPLGGVGTLRASIELLLGIGIDHVAVIDMLGLVDIVDSLDGVTLNVEEPIADPRYAPPTGGARGFFIEPGEHHVDGLTALAYARSRLGPNGNDFVRASRQQQLLSAIRARVRELGLVSTLPTLLDVVEANVRTDIPRDQLGELAQAVVDARWDELDRLVLDPPVYVEPDFTDGGAYILRPNETAIRDAVERMVIGPE
ncbi:MAG: LCP family protein [Chloroflexi bacterium]|nr:LCP family protein [Chloroflexota bacterium]